jgi:hypothetical protein
MKLPSIEFSVLPQATATWTDPIASRRPNPATDGSSSAEIFQGNVAQTRAERCDEPFGMIA